AVPRPSQRELSRPPAPLPARSRSEAVQRPAAGAPWALVDVLEAIVWPLASDELSALSSDYGDRRPPMAGASRNHAGLDLRAPGGTPIHAAADGRVVQSGVGGAYGNLVVLDHGAELQSLYAHNRANLVQVGDAVERGQVIALVGRTGNATGDHVHFELRWRGGSVDPWTVLPPLGTAPSR
ncbi:MAG: M23 family metallopeptidase, partial [Gemmatimonadota bacterium]